MISSYLFGRGTRGPCRPWGIYVDQLPPLYRCHSRVDGTHYSASSDGDIAVAHDIALAAIPDDIAGIAFEIATELLAGPYQELR
jgi:hypothetical protein